MNDGETIKDDYIPELDDPKEEEVPVTEESGLWETRITVNARQVVKISQNQEMTESKQYDVTDFLTQVQLDHILDCIHPINEI